MADKKPVVLRKVPDNWEQMSQQEQEAFAREMLQAMLKGSKPVPPEKGK